MARFVLAPRILVAAALLFVATPVPAETFTVTTTNDSGPGSLRHAMTVATPGSTIEFAIGEGHQIIRPHASYPAVSNVVIDGRTQPGYSGKPLIEITGGLDPVFDLHGGSMYGLVLNESHLAVMIANTAIYDCYFGTDITGSLDRRNWHDIWGTGVIERNLIAGALDIAPVRYDARHSVIRNNRIGTTATGDALLPPPDILSLSPAINVIFGATAVIEDNVIGGGSGCTICLIWNGSAVVRSNFIGVSRRGNPLPNSIGVEVYDSSDNIIADNWIANSREAGVLVSSSSSVRNRILNNRFENNTLAINLMAGYPDDVTLNDVGDLDVGPNTLLNFPVITRVVLLNGTTKITGTFDSARNTAYIIELFRSNACNPSRYGVAETRLAVLTVTTDDIGHAEFAVTVDPIMPGHVITATATGDSEGTSEVSRCALVEGFGEFHFASTTTTIPESSSSASITVKRRTGAVGAATVDFAMSNGTAVAGYDYTPLQGTLKFADGETSKTIHVQAIADATVEEDRTFFVKLSNPTTATLASPAIAAITIKDDDCSISPRKLLVPAGESRRVHIQIGAPAEGDAVFQVASSNPAAVRAPSSFVVPAGSTRGSFEVTASERRRSWTRNQPRFASGHTSGQSSPCPRLS